VTWPDPVAAYRELLQRLDAWFAESSARHPGVVPCRAGCSACCHGPFDISVADAVLVREAVTRLPEEEKLEVKRKAARQVETMSRLEPGWNVEYGVGGLAEAAFDRLSEAMADEPCPLLNEKGDCRIYEDRPLVCRMMGLGMVTPAGRAIENACPIADEFPLYARLPPQPFDLEALEDLEVACLEAASVELFTTPDQSGFETTIALTIVTSDM
jgi:Fe-S-cluster containining protein